MLIAKLYSTDDRAVWKCAALVDHTDMGEQKYSERTHCSVILSTTNPMWTGLGLNLGLCSDRSVTDRTMAWPLKILLITVQVC